MQAVRGNALMTTPAASPVAQPLHVPPLTAASNDAPAFASHASRANAPSHVAAAIAVAGHGPQRSALNLSTEAADRSPLASAGVGISLPLSSAAPPTLQFGPSALPYTLLRASASQLAAAASHAAGAHAPGAQALGGGAISEQQGYLLDRAAGGLAAGWLGGLAPSLSQRPDRAAPLVGVGRQSALAARSVPNTSDPLRASPDGFHTPASYLPGFSNDAPAVYVYDNALYHLDGMEGDGYGHYPGHGAVTTAAEAFDAPVPHGRSPAGEGHLDVPPDQYPASGNDYLFEFMHRMNNLPPDEQRAFSALLRDRLQRGGEPAAAAALAQPQAATPGPLRPQPHRLASPGLIAAQQQARFVAGGQPSHLFGRFQARRVPLRPTPRFDDGYAGQPAGQADARLPLGGWGCHLFCPGLARRT